MPSGIGLAIVPVLIGRVSAFGILLKRVSEFMRPPILIGWSLRDLPTHCLAKRSCL